MIVRLDTKIFLCLIIFFLTSQIDIYVLMVLFMTLHEIGHLLAGLILKFKIEKVNIILVGAGISFSIKNVDYNRKIIKGQMLNLKKAIVAISGPVVNIVIAIILILLKNQNYTVIYINLLIGIFNLSLIYPLDGGRVLKNILCIFVGKDRAEKYTYIISNINLIILGIFLLIVGIDNKNISMIMILIYVSYIVIRGNKTYKMRKKIIRCVRENIKIY